MLPWLTRNLLVDQVILELRDPLASVSVLGLKVYTTTDQCKWLRFLTTSREDWGGDEKWGWG